MMDFFFETYLQFLVPTINIAYKETFLKLQSFSIYRYQYQISIGQYEKI